MPKRNYTYLDIVRHYAGGRPGKGSIAERGSPADWKAAIDAKRSSKGGVSSKRPTPTSKGKSGDLGEGRWITTKTGSKVFIGGDGDVKAPPAIAGKDMDSLDKNVAGTPLDKRRQSPPPDPKRIAAAEAQVSKQRAGQSPQPPAQAPAEATTQGTHNVQRLLEKAVADGSISPKAHRNIQELMNSGMPSYLIAKEIQAARAAKEGLSSFTKDFDKKTREERLAIVGQALSNADVSDEFKRRLSDQIDAGKTALTAMRDIQREEDRRRQHESMSKAALAALNSADIPTGDKSKIMGLFRSGEVSPKKALQMVRQAQSRVETGKKREEARNVRERERAERKQFKEQEKAKALAAQEQTALTVLNNANIPPEDKVKIMGQVRTGEASPKKAMQMVRQAQSRVETGKKREEARNVRERERAERKQFKEQEKAKARAVKEQTKASEQAAAARTAQERLDKAHVSPQDRKTIQAMLDRGFSSRQIENRIVNAEARRIRDWQKSGKLQPAMAKALAARGIGSGSLTGRAAEGLARLRDAVLGRNTQASEAVARSKERLAQPTPAPQQAPMAQLTPAPQQAPTAQPTPAPQQAPTAQPTPAPQQAPTAQPTPAPQQAPTAQPTPAPQQAPMAQPTPAQQAPMAQPTPAPQQAPMAQPTPPRQAPMAQPTPAPQQAPMAQPTLQQAPETPSPAEDLPSPEESPHSDDFVDEEGDEEWEEMDEDTEDLDDDPDLDFSLDAMEGAGTPSVSQPEWEDFKGIMGSEVGHLRHSSPETLRMAKKAIGMAPPKSPQDLIKAMASINRLVNQRKQDIQGKDAGRARLLQALQQKQQEIISAFRKGRP